MISHDKVDKIYIRADANKEIGTGHIMRCLSIARKLVELKAEVIFIVADKCTQEFVEERGYEVICLNSTWNDFESELPIIRKLIIEKEIKKILIDDYFVTEKYLFELSKITETIYIDDVDAFIYPVNRLINYNIYANDLAYESRYRAANLKTAFLLGTEYAPLRGEFENIEKRQFRGLRKVLITSGGTDNYNMIGRILNCLEQHVEFADLHYYCVVGRFNTNKDELIEKYDSYKNVHLLFDIPNISDYMKECDVCITAGGTTVYELCACGIPSILYTLADNQLKCAKKVSNIGLMHWCGDVRYDIYLCLENIVNELQKFNSAEYCERISHRMQQYVDGMGAKRIAEEIMK